METMIVLSMANRNRFIMTLEKKIARAFALDDATWMRHANPWSVGLRFTVLPIIILAFWSRIWIGWWAVVPVLIALFWNWVNPRIFPAPRSFDHWMSKAVMGERAWMNRDIVPVPAWHRKVPPLLSWISALGILWIAWGVLVLDIWQTLLGLVIVYSGKVWFLDRMVWLWHDVKDFPSGQEEPVPVFPIFTKPED
jgi:hypothetical protein